MVVNQTENTWNEKKNERTTTKKNQTVQHDMAKWFSNHNTYVTNESRPLCALALITAVNQVLIILQTSFYKYRYKSLVILILHNLIFVKHSVKSWFLYPLCCTLVFYWASNQDKENLQCHFFFTLFFVCIEHCVYARIRASILQPRNINTS